MISENEVRAKIVSAEATLSQCFDYLLIMKHADGDIANAILSFQPMLADCLYELMSFYKKLMTEKHDLIAVKASYSKADFSKVMAQNNSFAEVIKKTIEIGKGLGDAFAWYFYRDNFSELGKHFEHKSTGLFVAGIGGRGEIEFIKSNQNFNGLFVLYHSITSMLRIGDFSLYALDAGIVGVGELKTEQENHKLKVTAHITSKVNLRMENKPAEHSNKTMKFIGTSMEVPRDIPRLGDQLLAQDKLLEKTQADMKANQFTEYEHALINHLANGESIVLNSDDTLLLLIGKNQESSLFDNLIKKDEDFELPKEFQSSALKIMFPNSDNNRAIIGAIDTTMSHSRIPVFWWKIEDGICREIYFRRVSIATVFNPAKLIQHYIDAGYSVVNSKDVRKIELQKVWDGKKIGLGNFEMYFDLISHSLMKTQYVTELIDQLLHSIENGDYEPNSKIDMKIQLHTFGGPPHEA